MYRVSPYLRRYGLALLSGVGLATLWVNLAPESYYDAVEWRLADLPLPQWIAPFPISLTPMGLVSDGLMALFLFFVGKEAWEALVLDRGALARGRAAVPLAGAMGGMAGAILVWLASSALIETAAEAGPGTGWAVPVGSDLVLCYLLGRRIFGPGHPALHVILLVNVVMDIAALVSLGFSGPAPGLRLFWLLVPLAVSAAVWWTCGRPPAPGASEISRRRRMALWPYLLGGLVSWAGTLAAGLPGALGLLPMIPAIPHANRAFGFFAEAEGLLHDPLNRLAHLLAGPLVAVLFLVGLTRGGVDLAAAAPTTLVTLAALWIGKPAGFLAGALLAMRVFGRPLPPGLRLRDLTVIALICGMGLTVPLLAVDLALPGGAMTEAARLGLALSLLAAPLVLLAHRALPR